MNSASCRRFAGSGTSAVLRQRPARTICGNVPETSHSLPERSLVSVRIRPSNSSSVRSCRPPVDRLPTACGSLQMPTSLPSAEACFADGRFPLVVRACEKVGRSVRSPARFVRGGFFDLSDQKPEQFAQGDGQAFRSVFFAEAGLYALPPRCIPIVGRESGRDDAVSLFVLLQRKSVFFGERRQRSVPCFGLFGEAAEKQREHVVVIGLAGARRGLRDVFGRLQPALSGRDRKKESEYDPFRFRSRSKIAFGGDNGPDGRIFSTDGMMEDRSDGILRLRNAVVSQAAFGTCVRSVRR